MQLEIPIREGIEGFRSILREIYRAGHISLKDLAYETLIPVSLLSKIVNFLTEKDILTRIPEGILYTENGMQYIEKELNFYGFGISECEECNGLPIYISPRWNGVIEELERIFATRPKVNTTLDQAFADPETSLMRALYLYRNGALEGKKICFLGDDDYTSVATALLYKGFYPEEPKLIPNQLTIIDIDNRILQGIRSHIPKNFNIFTEIWDYRNAVPAKFQNIFDTIIVDPPYSNAGLKLVLSRSLSLLRKELGAEIYLSFAHRAPEEFYNLQKLIIDSGLAIMEIIPRFNYYEGAQILGSTTQMIRLSTTSESIPLIKSNEVLEGPIYTGEISMNFRIYYCKNCEKSIRIGEGCDIKTIEELKKHGCPYCNSHGKFELDEKIKIA
ncbi:MAG: bis-aminopropyl spermidine synthase family protein [Promethearchaeota archaeon]